MRAPAGGHRGAAGARARGCIFHSLHAVRYKHKQAHTLGTPYTAYLPILHPHAAGDGARARVARGGRCARRPAARIARGTPARVRKSRLCEYQTVHPPRSAMGWRVALWLVMVQGCGGWLRCCAAGAECPANWTVGIDIDCCNIVQSGPHTQNECCAMCQAHPHCAAAVWNAGTDRWCNLKWSSAKQKHSKAGEQLVQIRPPGPPPPGPTPPPAMPKHPVKPPPATQPDWGARYRAGHLLYADAAAVAAPLQQHIMPEVGNGYVGVQAHARPSIIGDYLMVGGVYNGRADSGDAELDGPSHRAMIPSFLPSIIGPTTTIAADTALDMEQAAFITRGKAGKVAVEQRLYAHW